MYDEWAPCLPRIRNKQLFKPMITIILKLYTVMAMIKYEITWTTKIV